MSDGKYFFDVKKHTFVNFEIPLKCRQRTGYDFNFILNKIPQLIVEDSSFHWAAVPQCTNMTFDICLNSSRVLDLAK